MERCSAISNSADKCLFAVEHCQLDTFVQYSKWYFCAGSSLPDWARNAAVVLVLVYLFSVVGIAAFDFMCPNLRVMAAHSGLSQSVLGVTFLAFANGSVDVFGAIAAMGQGNASLAVGEIIGASMFIIAVVVGTIAIYSGRGEEGVKIEPRYFRRDALFLLLATILIGFCLYDGQITLRNSLLMLGAYCAYALMVVWDHMQNPSETVSANVSRSCSPECASRRSSIDHEEFDDEALNLNRARNSLFSSFEYYQARIHHNAHPELGNIPPYELRLEIPPEAEVHDYGAVSPLNRLPGKLHVRDLPRLDTALHVPASASTDGGNTLNDETNSHREVEREGSFSPYVYGNHGRNFGSRHSLGGDHHELHTFPLLSVSGNSSTTSLTLAEDVSLKDHLFPVAAYWEEQTFLGRVVAVAMILPILVFKATIPVPLKEAQPSLNKIYAFCIPITAATLLHAPLSCLPVLIVVLGSTCLFFGLCIKRRKAGVLVMSTAGFLMSVLWVIKLAGELVGALQLLAVISEVNHAVLGVTVFALGDSLGDLISNVTIAEQGYPTMAIAACLGSPAFTMLVGIGGASLLTMLRTKKAYIEIDISKSLSISCCTIIVTLLFLLTTLHIHEYRIKWQIGVVTISAWLLTLVASVFFNS